MTFSKAMGAFRTSSRILVVLLSLLCFSAAQAQDYDNVVVLEASETFSYDLREALLTAQPGTVIELPEGTFQFNSDVIILTSHITLRGKGMDKTILSFKGQADGAEGIQVFADAFVAEDFAIEDTAGDGLRIEGSNGVVVRRVRVEWTNGPDEHNGAYGLYPVLCENVLIEDSVVKGASDAGIYVGQSKHIIIRNNLAEYNVAGIEVENSQYADVYGNLAQNNTGGILIFDLPGLTQEGHHTRVYNNTSINNNTKNFAPAGNIVGKVPTGTGLMILATDYVDIYDNVVTGNKTGSMLVSSFNTVTVIDGTPIPDGYDPYPEFINIRDNVMHRQSGYPWSSGEMGILISLDFLIHWKKVSDVIVDGVARDSLVNAQICISENKHADGRDSSFGNLRMSEVSSLFKWLGLPVGGLLSTDITPHQCLNAAWDGVELAPWPEIPEPDIEYTDEEIAALCATEGTGVNSEALVVDCPLLSSYRLFDDSTDPTQNANGGVFYDLISPLFTDYASKYRFVYVPEGTQATYTDTDIFDFPVGSVIAKTFTAEAIGYDQQILEVRLLIRRASGWVGLPYVWSETNSDGELANEGAVLSAMVSNDAGELIALDGYAVPRKNQCASCHRKADDLFRPIGPKAKLMNSAVDYGDIVENQLSHWVNLGILKDAPIDPADAPQSVDWKDESASLDERARAYLDVQCAHCHIEGGRADSTGLHLDEEESEATSFGVCKTPVAAGSGSGGLLVDIFPGAPDDSILAYRMGSNDPAVRMPELGRSIVHTEGTNLIRDWISAMPGSCQN
ncbi:MAG: right-handed parallel beta-helix repeat-containing protein [Pseudomonadales bacterium]|nr:right-handed parallel beta-helix repeat-containing protein [Pseudomonadales bacterium]